MLGEEHKDTLGTMMNMGLLHHQTKTYEGALDFYRKALEVKERVLGKTNFHPGHHQKYCDCIHARIERLREGRGDVQVSECMRRRFYLILKSNTITSARNIAGSL